MLRIFIKIITYSQFSGVNANEIYNKLKKEIRATDVIFIQP